MTILWGSCGSGNSFTGAGPAKDGSGYVLSADSSGNIKVTAKDGRVVFWTNSGNNYVQPVATDDNGNEITVDTSSSVFTDTFGVTALTLGGSGTPASPKTFTYTAPSGANAVYTLKYTAYTVKTNFGCSGISEYGPTAQNLPSELDLPDGSTYIFTYESTPGFSGDVTARLASVKLPTGGTINYTYTGSNNGIVCTDGSAAGLTRQTPDGTWTYSHTIDGYSTPGSTTITDPQSNQTVMSFVEIFPTETSTYQGSMAPANLLKTSLNCYNGTVPSGTPATCGSASITLPITELTSYIQLPNGSSFLESKVDTFYDKETVGSTTNSNGLLTETDEYGYGAGAPGALVRKTLTTYATLANNIVNRPATVTVQDGSGNVRAQTTYCYDEGTPSGTTTCNATGSPTATAGTPQHVAITGSRGNPTTITSLVTGSTTLGKKVTYYDTGNINVATDVNGAQTTYTYGSGSCGNSFATSVSEPLSLSKSIAWNCTGGVATSVTDESGKTASTGYTDADFWRPNSTTDELSNVTNLTYTAQTSVESSMVFNSSSSTTDIVSTFDSLGRAHISQTKESPSSSTYDSVETDYDSLGRPNRSTLPYAGTAGQTNSSAPSTIITYDALDRATAVTDGGGGYTAYSYVQNDTYQTTGPKPSGENLKLKQLEYDGLGRLTSVCEITSAAGSGTCAQSSPVTGYWTKYTYDVNNNLTGVTQNAQSLSVQTRTYAYDDMERMTSETNPESGTTNYTYDTDATCGTSKGDLVKKVDVVGNTICYAYDALHRLTAVTFPSGPYSSVSPQKHFVYDSATVNSVAMVSAKARLAEAYTCFSPCSTKLTDEGFSYTARGEISDLYESTPHSGGYYHLTQTYWANGATNQLGGLSGLPTITYNVDGEGRIYSATASSGQNPLSSTTYNVASLPTAVNLGSSDSDSFAYDSNTNRMTRYQFSLNSQSVVGNLTWNALGTLGSLGITDPFNSSNTQTCNYSHDDLARIAGDNCGSAWSQTFTFDPLGNIQKSGSSSFGATYSNSTNQMTEIGSSVPSYDANGNVTNDFLNTYAWDASSRPITIDSVNVTYDALGGMVELNRSGSYTEIAYAPSGGKLALMSGSSLQKGFVPLVGGSMAVYGSAGLDHYRHSDWLGSNRLCSSPSRTVTCDLAYGPYGETYAPSGSVDASFTGMNQDTATSLYDFPAREYGIQGRWPSPDPAGIDSVDLTDPQTWNRYAYVRNSPLDRTDPTGLCGEMITTTITDLNGNIIDSWSSPGPACNFWDLVRYFGQGAFWSTPGFYLHGGGGGAPSQQPQDPNCQADPGLSIKSGGVTLGGTAAAGAGRLGGSAATGSVGVVTGKGAPVVGVASGGVMTSAGNYVGGSPNQGPIARTYGAYIGGGFSATASNGVPGQLRGPFQAMNVQIGLLGFSVGAEFACSGNVCQGSVSPPGFGVGIGAQITTITTNTAVTTKQCKQGG